VRYLLISFCVLGSSFNAIAQHTSKKVAAPCGTISYKISKNGDTINRIDCKNLKQGYWQEISQENDFVATTNKEVGHYVNGKKEGVWKTYEDAAVKSIITYVQGSPDGEAQYFEDGYLACIGRFKAIAVGKQLDTIAVYNPDTGNDTLIAVKKPTGVLKHGTWQYFNQAGTIIEEREYWLDEVVQHKTHPERQLTDKEKLALERNLPHRTGRVQIPMHKAQKVPKVPETKVVKGSMH
jgi:hypothetical protein